MAARPALPSSAQRLLAYTGLPVSGAAVAASSRGRGGATRGSSDQISNGDRRPISGYGGYPKGGPFALPMRRSGASESTCPTYSRTGSRSPPVSGVGAPGSAHSWRQTLHQRPCGWLTGRPVCGSPLQHAPLGVPGARPWPPSGPWGLSRSFEETVTDDLRVVNSVGTVVPNRAQSGRCHVE